MPEGNPAGYMKPPMGGGGMPPQRPAMPQGPARPQQGGADPALDLIRAGVAKLSPQERQVLVQAINPQVREVMGKAFGPGVYQFLAPFVADDANVAGGPPQQGAQPQPMAAPGGPMRPQTPLGRLR